MIHRVFQEMGVGNPTVLHDYYQSRLIEYDAHLVSTCQQLQKEYISIVQPDGVNSSAGQTPLRFQHTHFFINLQL